MKFIVKALRDTIVIRSFCDVYSPSGNECNVRCSSVSVDG